MKKSCTFKTSDLGFTAALVSNHYAELVGLDKANPKKVMFILAFSNEDDFHYWGSEYTMGQIEVDAQSYFNTVKTLKNRIYSDIEQGKGGAK